MVTLPDEGQDFYETILTKFKELTPLLKRMRKHYMNNVFPKNHRKQEEKTELMLKDLVKYINTNLN
jgi:hypothetical protein